ELLSTKILRDTNPEQEPVASRIEVGWLSLIGSSWLNRVLRPDGHIDFLLPVSVHVPEHQVEGAVRILFPPFVRRWNILTTRKHPLGADGWQHRECSNHTYDHRDHGRRHPLHNPRNVHDRHSPPGK